MAQPDDRGDTTLSEPTFLSPSSPDGTSSTPADGQGGTTPADTAPDSVSTTEQPDVGSAAPEPVADPTPGPGNDEAQREAAQLQADIDAKQAELDDLQRQVAEAHDELTQLRADKADAQDAGTAPEPASSVEGPDEVRRLIVTDDTDSLDDIADRENVDRDKLFTLNRPALEAAAQARGFSGSDDGRLLFVGTTLTLP